MELTTGQPTVQFLDNDGNPCGRMTLYGDVGSLIMLDENTRELARSEVGDGLESSVLLEKIQLLEGRRYDYVLEDIAEGLCLDYESNPCIIPHRKEERFGHIEPGTYTGLLQFRLVDSGGETVASACVDVQSSKAGSLRHYMTMVGDIAERSAELLMQVTSPTQARFESFGEEDAQTLTQRFFFLEALLGKRSFQDALERIVRNPHVRSTGEMVDKSLSRDGFSIRANELLQIASRYPRIKLPSHHSLRTEIPELVSIPLTVATREHRDFADTPENRFIKHALQQFMLALQGIAETIMSKQNSNVARHVAGRARALAEKIEERLVHSFYRELSPPVFLPLGSPVLQRKEGYREVLEAWLKFDLASQLVWQGGDEIFGAGKRDVAKLYEFWLCFKLEDTMNRIFGMDTAPQLIKASDNGLELTLESGKSLEWQGYYPRGAKPLLNVRFSFNRSFTGQGQSGRTAEHGSIVNYELGTAGTWTANMRPDYTVSLWPSNMCEPDAEREEQIIHLHFDAKYRVENVSAAKGSPFNILDLFAEETRPNAPSKQQDVGASAGFGEDSEMAIEEQEQAEKDARLSKRADLLKMHAYRDAIRRSEGAYILYPGNHEKRWAAYHELLPGIGAFPVCPGGHDNMENVANFLKQAAELCVDRFSQLHRHRYWTENIMTDQRGDYQVSVPQGLHTKPCAPGVIVGFIRHDARSLCETEGVFYFHAVDNNNEPMQFDQRILSAKSLVPFSTSGYAGTEWLSWWAEIEGITMVHRDKLENFSHSLATLERPQNVDYYYIATLKRQHNGLFARKYDITWTSPAVSAPNSLEPAYSTWENLQTAQV